MKSIRLLIAALAIGASGTALAVPNLQLDGSGGTYDPVNEDVVLSDSMFTLYALVKDGQYAAGQTYYLSIAISPQQTETAPPPSFGTFDISVNGGASVSSSTLSLYYGTPPATTGDPDLPSHGIFPTYFYEIAFTALPGTSGIYNTQDDPGGPMAGTGLSYAYFDIDTTGLGEEYGLHFDLYTFTSTGRGRTQIEKAPFSHDASTGRKVPDGGGTLLGLALGLLGIGGFRKLLVKKA